MKQNNKQRTAVKVMDIIGEVLPEEGFTPNKCHRRIKIACVRGVNWPKGVIKRLYHFYGDPTVFKSILPGDLVYVEGCIETKKGKHRCLRTIKQTVITILPVLEDKVTSHASAPQLSEAVK